MTNETIQLPISILLVDDDDVAREAVIRSLARAGVEVSIVVADDGLEALDILRGRHAAKKISDPKLVLLDLNMPRMDGFQFMAEVRSDPGLQDLVIFVLTTSGLDADRNRAYQEHIAGYMVKSAVGPQFVKLASLLKYYGVSVSFPKVA